MDVTPIGKNDSVKREQTGNRKRATRNISPPKICTNSCQMGNDVAFNVLDQDIFTSQDKEYLLLLGEL